MGNRKHPGGGFGTATDPTQGSDTRNHKKTIKELLDYCKPQMVALVIALFCGAASALLTLVGPEALGRVTNLIQEGLRTSIDLQAVVTIAVFLAALYLLSMLLGFTQGFLLATVTQKISRRLRSDVSSKIDRMPINYFHKTSYGDVLSRVTNDVDSLGQALNQGLGTLVSALTLFVGSLVMMLLTNVLMALTAVVATAIGFFLMRLIMGHSQKYFVRQQQNLGEMNGYIEEMYTGHSVVRIYNAEARTQASFEKINATLCESAFRAQCISGLMQPLMYFIGNLAYVVVCVVGALLAAQGKIPFGVIVAFMLYIRFFTQPLSQLAQVGVAMQSASAAGERVFRFLEEEEMADEANKPAVAENVRGAVEFRNVFFSYPDTEKPVIRDFSAKVAAGQKIAIVGPTGAGKTTLVNLLMRFHEIQGGEILIDGVPIQSLRREAVHELFCMVLQDTWLFEGTIRENVVYSKENVSEAELIRACKAVGIHRLIKTLPQGYDTVLDEESALSVGEKQQLTIARAMIKNAPMLILDEATSSVDTRTELVIQQAMDQLMEGRTAFVIAHRLSTIKNADLILVIREGDIVESGDHETLLQQGGFYATLYNSQFEEAEPA